MATESVQISREELYKLVWSEPGKVLANRFGISDVGLSKICKRHRIPRPPRGYWAKRQAGHKPTKEPLPPIADASLNSIAIRAGRNLAEVSEKSEPPEISAIQEFESQDKNRISVPDRVDRYHSVLSETRRSMSNRPGNGYPHARYGKSRIATVSVEKSSLARAFKVLDTMIKAFEARHYNVAFRDDGKKGLYVEIFDEKLEIIIREPTKRVDHVLTPGELARKKEYGWDIHTKYDYVPTGNLVLELNGTGYGSADARVADTKTKRIEDRLNELVVKGAQAAWELRARRLIREEERRLYELKWREQEARERKKREAVRRRNLLLLEAERFAKAKELREYVAAVRKAVKTGEQISEC